jgi:hypothetical protein
MPGNSSWMPYAPQGVTGLEMMNYMTELKSYIQQLMGLLGQLM